jgi:LemA protein
MDLQHQLEATENRIAVERRKFNEITRGFNTAIRKFPASIIANMRDFEKQGYFEALEGSETAPVVEF